MKCEQFRDNLQELIDSASVGEEMLAHKDDCEDCGFLYNEFMAIHRLIEEEQEVEIPPFAETRMLSVIQQWQDKKAVIPTLRLKQVMIGIGVAASITAGVTIGLQVQRFPGTDNQNEINLQEMRNELNVPDFGKEDVINFD